MKNIFSFVLVLVLALALVASTAVAEDVPSLTGSMIMTALEEVSAGVREDVTEIMDELGMDAETTHFQRFASRETGDVMKKSFAMIQFPTESNDFTLDFIKVANDLDADERHIFLVCGHAKPENCVGDDPHPGAPGDHPCGEADAAPEAAEKTGAFCELLSANTTTGREGEVLLYGAEPIEYLKTTHEEMKAKGETMSVPTIHLEILDADEVEKMMEEAEETEPTDEDAAGAPAPAPEPANRRRRLLRIGGGGIGGGRIGGGRIGGGIGGPGLGRGGALGGRGFGRGGMGVNQVIRGCTFAGSRCGGAGTYFNVPKLAAGRRKLLESAHRE